VKNIYSDEKAAEFLSDLELRVYTSNLLGQSDELVLHGGGNTSVKSVVDGEAILHVKGSGWDLVSIKAEGFAPVKMQTLLEMAQRQTLSDSEMVRGQKAAMIDSSAPNPSVEAILHALIPYKFVDHTHADAIVTISNSKDGKRLIEELFPNFLIVPYVMPGFILARTIYEMTQSVQFSDIEGIILHHHGIFTFDDNAKASYSKMIDAVSRAEEFLQHHAPLHLGSYTPKSFDVSLLQQLLSNEKGYDVHLHVNQEPLALEYASQENLKTFATRGVLTPEHIIRTKRTPLVLESKNIDRALNEYIMEYMEYFNNYATDEIALNPAPNYLVIKDFGIITCGKTPREAEVMNDVIEHTMKAVLQADKLGGYRSISVEESFAMEYWELEQAKLK
jgi:rhamnose utilization protein RhaD (predicted bifunctional aldolase and dehydrogenase)